VIRREIILREVMKRQTAKEKERDRDRERERER